MPGSRERGEEAMQVTGELFRQVPLFSGLADEDLESLLAVATRRKFPKDAVIFFEHDLGDALFMILSGRIKVTILSDDGREIILAMLSDRDFFGEMSLLACSSPFSRSCPRGYERRISRSETSPSTTSTAGWRGCSSRWRARAEAGGRAGGGGFG